MEEETQVEEVQQEPTSVVDSANAAADRLEAATSKMEAMLKRQEALRVQEMLGGKADAGNPKVEESAEEYTNKVLAGDLD